MKLIDEYKSILTKRVWLITVMLFSYSLLDFDSKLFFKGFDELN